MSGMGQGWAEELGFVSGVIKVGGLRSNAGVFQNLRF